MAFIGAKRKPLTEGADGSGAGFGQEGKVKGPKDRIGRLFESGI
jgi:hypothetical protein